MKLSLRRFFFIGSMVLCLIVNPDFVRAQPGPGGDVDVPIDGGVSILIAAGVGYGIKKVREERKKKADQLQ